MTEIISPNFSRGIKSFDSQAGYSVKSFISGSVSVFLMSRIPGSRASVAAPFLGAAFGPLIESPNTPHPDWGRKIKAVLYNLIVYSSIQTETRGLGFGFWGLGFGVW